MSQNMRELGTTGLRRTGGFVIEDFLPQLQGIRGVRVYREMADNDPTIGSILFAIEKVLQRLEWRVDPSDPDDEVAAEYAQFIEECLYDMSDSWDATLSAILSMLTYGWSWHEVVYKKREGYSKNSRKRSKFDDGKIGWRKWAIRSQETLWEWEFDDAGGIQGFWQVDPYMNAHRVFIPIEKSLLFRTTTVKNNPEGRSLLRNAYRSWWYKRRIEEIEAVGIERDLAGLPVAHVPPEYLSSAATPEQVGILNAIKDIVTGIKRNEQEGVIYPAMYDQQGNRLFELTLMSSGGSRQFDIDKTVHRYDQRIAMTLLSDFILLGHERVGSFALGTAKMDLWSVAVDAVARSIAEVVNQHAIPTLLRLNGMDDELSPELAYGEVAQTDIGEVAKFVVDLIGAGVMQPDGLLEEYMRDLGGLPSPDPDAAPMMPNGEMPDMPGMEPEVAAADDPFSSLPSLEEVMDAPLEEPDITAEN